MVSKQQLPAKGLMEKLETTNKLQWRVEVYKIKRMKDLWKVILAEYKLTLGLLEEEKNDLTIDLTKRLKDSIPGIKKKMKFYDLDRVKLEIAEASALARRVEINMNVQHWK